MKRKQFLCAAAVSATGLMLSVRPSEAVPFNLGTAGPNTWAVLETGNGNVSLANAANAGYVVGNVGVAGTGNISDGGSLPITGNVELGTSSGSSGLSGNVSGSITQNSASQTALNQAAAAAIAASSQLAAMASSGGGVGISQISQGSTLSAGVYNLSSMQLNNGAQLVLSGNASSQFIFNISGQMSLNSAQIVLSGGLNADDVIYNITGNQAVQFSGGLNDPHGEAALAGIILATNAAIQISPGEVTGEIISGQNINISSGGSVDDITAVPDGGSTAVLLGAAMSGVGLIVRRCKR